MYYDITEIMRVNFLIFIMTIGMAHSSDYSYEQLPEYPGRRLVSQSVQLKEIPTKIIRITKTIAIKVPVPYPVKIPVHIPVPVPVKHPIMIPVPQIVKVPEHVPYEVSKHVPVELHQQVPVVLTKPVLYPQPYPAPHSVKFPQPVPYPVSQPIQLHSPQLQSNYNELNHINEESKDDESHVHQRSYRFEDENEGKEEKEKSFDSAQPIVVE